MKQRGIAELFIATGGHAHHSRAEAENKVRIRGGYNFKGPPPGTYFFL